MPIWGNDDLPLTSLKKLTVRGRDNGNMFPTTTNNTTEAEQPDVTPPSPNRPTFRGEMHISTGVCPRHGNICQRMSHMATPLMGAGRFCCKWEDEKYDKYDFQVSAEGARPHPHKVWQSVWTSLHMAILPMASSFSAFCWIHACDWGLIALS